MKISFKNLLLITGLIVSTFSTLFAQRDLVISGGNNVSSFVCANRKAYTWGNNTGGQLGNGSGAANVTSPTAVVGLPANTDIEQINSGSGAHFLALTCEITPGAGGGIFAWGNNKTGQVGNGTTTSPVTTPTRVKLGVLPAATYDPTGTGGISAGIQVVYAGNSNSYAITTSGNLIAWGANDAGVATDPYDDANGQLGDGTQVSKTTPVFVRSGVTGNGQTNGQPLVGVTQVFAGDNVAYALVDPDGDGIGTVYSWGNGLNGTLGRNAGGTANPASNAAVQDSYARPVYYGGNGGGTGQMSNIIAISSADVFGMALDDQGYVWTWGNGGWNNSTGSTTTNQTYSDPRRVIAGNTTGASTDGNGFLLAISIGGGQGYGMAVAADGKPVAWGGQGLDQDPGPPPAPICSNGGLTGTGITTKQVPPSYIKRGAVVDNDVILINRGDTWGYYQRADGTFYTWGCNIYGQLGIGNTNNQSTAVAITPPSGCDLKDPKPTVDLTPGDITTCASDLAITGLVLDAGFTISAALAPNYLVTWKKGTGIVKSGTATTANLTYTATSPGTYSVTIHYQGTNAGCTPFDDAVGTMTITGYPATFTAPTNLTYCGTSATVNVSQIVPPALTTANYKWYPTTSSNTVLGTTVGSGNTTINVSTATAGTGTDKIVYVEETGYGSGIVFAKNQSCDATFGAGSNGWETLNNNQASNPNYQTQFTAYENISLQSVDVTLRLQVYSGVGTSISGRLNMAIYGSKTDNNGKLIPDQTKVLGTFFVDFSRTKGPANVTDSTATFTVPINNIPILGTTSGSTFFISLQQTAMTNFTGNGGVAIGKADCSQSVPINDNINGKIVSLTGSTQAWTNHQDPPNNKGGHFYNVKFSTGQKYCDRIPVTIKQSCPCTAPGSPTASAPASFCAGTTSPAWTAATTGTGNELVWYTVATGGTGTTTVRLSPWGPFFICAD